MKSFLFIMASAFSFSATAEVYEIPIFAPTQHTCAELQNAVNEYGEIYIQHQGYRRYVKNQSYCGKREQAKWAMEVSSDVFFCSVGKRCKKITNMDF